jgi:hypothetical protein
MAKKPSRQQEIEALVKIKRQGPAFGAGLAVNPDFAPPNAVDRERGVEPDASERAQAEQAVATRALAELQPLNYRLWILHEEDRLGSREALIDALLDVKPIPARTRPMPDYGKGDERRAYREALKRSIQRSGPAREPGRKEEHKKITQADYRERIALLILGHAQVVLAVYGLWAYVTEGERDEHYNWMYTDPSDTIEREDARRILASGGSDRGEVPGIVSYVWHVNDQKTVGSAQLNLVKLHGIQVQIDQGRA